MDPTRFLLFVAFLGGLANIGFYITKDRSMEQTYVANDVQTDAPLLSLATSDNHSCGIGAGGGIWCWGDGKAGQLGHGQFVSSNRPVPVPMADAALDIDVAGHTSCAVLYSGSTWCWGASAQGQLADDSPIPARAFPKAIPIPPANSVRVGLGQVCALLRTGDTACWGEIITQEEQRLYILNRGDVRRIPHPVALTDIQMGSTFVCGLDIAGDVTCWGDNTNQRLAPVDNRMLNTPVPIALPAKAVTLKTGQGHACAILETQELWCWGDSAGFTVDDTGMSGPTLVGTVPSPLLALGKDTTCFFAGTVFCIGDERERPIAIARTIPPFVAMDMEGSRLCGLDATGGAWCATDTIQQAGLRPSDWREDLSLRGRWNRLVGLWADRQS